jgi:hypothetical protein
VLVVELLRLIALKNPPPDLGLYPLTDEFDGLGDESAPLGLGLTEDDPLGLGEPDAMDEVGLSNEEERGPRGGFIAPEGFVGVRKVEMALAGEALETKTWRRFSCPAREGGVFAAAAAAEEGDTISGILPLRCIAAVTAEWMLPALSSDEDADGARECRPGCRGMNPFAYCAIRSLGLFIDADVMLPVGLDSAGGAL